MQADVVVGAGIAGAATAWWLSPHVSVIVLEAEAHAGTHATGRSAAVLTTTTGSDIVSRLTVASRQFYVNPPDGFSDVPLARSRAVLRVGGDGGWAGTERLDAAEARRLVPPLRDRWATSAFLEADGLELDVDALLQSYLRGVRRHGGKLLVGAPVTGIERRGTAWRMQTDVGTITAGVIVDAAGAWADDVARLAGIAPIGLQPMRRTAFLFRGPGGAEGWPLVMDAAEQWYVKPDAGLLLGSPADETPTEPCDARPEELDIAVGIERITAALEVEIRSIHRAWAGLRTFAPDRDPVVGADARHPTFVWLAGQGGYGIKIAPEVGRLAAAAALGEPTAEDLLPAR